eukprot:6744467-Pyramimonas_sp.AAC.1
MYGCLTIIVSLAPDTPPSHASPHGREPAWSFGAMPLNFGNGDSDIMLAFAKVLFQRQHGAAPKRGLQQ